VNGVGRGGGCWIICSNVRYFGRYWCAWVFHCSSLSSAVVVLLYLCRWRFGGRSSLVVEGWTRDAAEPDKQREHTNRSQCVGRVLGLDVVLPGELWVIQSGGYFCAAARTWRCRRSPQRACSGGIADRGKTYLGSGAFWGRWRCACSVPAGYWSLVMLSCDGECNGYTDWCLVVADVPVAAVCSCV
jgi:hypothetical protein